MTKSDPTLPDYVRRALEDPQRLAVLEELDVLDTPPDRDFDRLARMAAALFNASFSQVTLLNANRQWYRACFGVEGLSETPAEQSFCAYTIAAPGEELVVCDASQHPDFAENPFVTGWPGIRFYAGVPIVVRGERIGTICVLDPTPREAPAEETMALLRDLAATAASLLSLKDEARNRARTSAALLREEWRHAFTLEAGNVGSWMLDIPTRRLTCNDAFRRMNDFGPGAAIQMSDVLDAWDEKGREAVAAALASSLVDGSDYEAEGRVSSNGHWLAMRGRIYQRDDAGKPLVMMGVAVDITESRRSAEQTRSLLRELNHRVKNTLAMIQSVARQTLRQHADPQDFIDAFSGRLRTISEIHVLLADQDWSGVHLRQILEAQLGGDLDRTGPGLKVSGPDVLLPPDHAVGLGILLHEMATNARHHGASSVPSGEVSVDWRVESDPVPGLRLDWLETGGPKVDVTAERGLGRQLIERGLTKVLGSQVQLDMHPGGVRAAVWLPLPEA
ncbi:MAG: GAF domain-containing protein [Devosia sp.]|uniref:sensor histidine kinase n=1 Tax=Devosia sp. TaxID=1871048 RepID=UPI0024CC17FF|nr:HWE histidine kinase domain-containing protein [Devosia sp.]UYO01137.1 MAG: GAF domain-containing protein [Devosia sp.]